MAALILARRRSWFLSRALFRLKLQTSRAASQPPSRACFETNDYWDSSATAPTSTLSLIAAATAAINDPTRKFGVIAFAQPLRTDSGAGG